MLSSFVQCTCTLGKHHPLEVATRLDASTDIDASLSNSNQERYRGMAAKKEQLVESISVFRNPPNTRPQLYKLKTWSLYTKCNKCIRKCISNQQFGTMVVEGKVIAFVEFSNHNSPIIIGIIKLENHQLDTQALSTFTETVEHTECIQNLGWFPAWIVV